MTKLKFAVAGLGRIGKIHLENLLQMSRVKIVAVMDPMEESKQYARDKGVSNVTSTYEAMLASTDIDVVVICSPTDTHADYVEMAAKAGKHVFCEKPLDLSLDRVVEVLDVVKDTNIKLMIGFNRRFDKEFKKVKALVSEGAIGDHHLVKITSRDPGAPPVSYIENLEDYF